MAVWICMNIKLNKISWVNVNAFGMSMWTPSNVFRCFQCLKLFHRGEINCCMQYLVPLISLFLFLYSCCTLYIAVAISVSVVSPLSLFSANCWTMRRRRHCFYACVSFSLLLHYYYFLLWIFRCNFVHVNGTPAAAPRTLGWIGKKEA